MEQRITRAKAPRRRGRRAVRDAGRGRARERLAAVAAMIYLVFNEGYSATGGEAQVRAPLCDEAIRLARLLLRLFQAEPEIMGLTALHAAAACARAGARFDAEGEIVLLEDQDRSLWNRQDDRRGPGADRQGDAPSPPRRLSGAGRDRRAACAGGDAPRTPTGRRSICSTARSNSMQPLAVVTLNRAVAVAKVRGAGGGAGDDRAAGRAARRLFLFISASRAALLLQLGRNEEARVAFDRAIALANTAAEAAHIRMHLDRLTRAQTLQKSLR